MADENESIVQPIEAALAQQTITPPPANNFDDMPIGGGPKMTFSQFPSENDAPPAKKPIIRKAAKVPKKQESRKQNVSDGNIKMEEPIKNNQPLDQLPVGGNKPSMFDEKPIGKSEFNMSEFPEGGEQTPVETNYTMMQKLKSKAAKLRLSGMQDLLAMLEQDPDNSEISEVTLPGLLKQTTPANIQKIVQCLKVWVQKGKQWGEDEAKLSIENGYINGKTNSRKATVQAIDLMYEQKPAIIEMILLTGLKGKTPKIVAGYIGMINQLLMIYGIKRMNYLKPYIPEIVRIISSEKLPAIKTEGMNTLREAYKWLSKDVVEPMLKELKEGLKKELDTFWETYDTTIVMTAPKDIKQEGGGKNKGKKIDAYDLSEAVDVFKKFNQKWSQSVLKAQKWNQKTRLMQEFTKGASVPKIANTDFRHVAQLIRRLINDSNFNVVLWNLKIMAIMSKGLRKNFAPYAKNLFSNVIAKFRDKKTLMVEQTFKTLNDLNYCLGIEDVLDDVKEGLNDKAPNMRCNLLNWIGKLVQQKAQQKAGECPEKTKDAIKQLFPLFDKLIADGVSEVRQTMAKNLGKMQLVLGQQFFAPIKNKVNKNLANKIGSQKNSQTKQKAPSKDSKKPEQDLTKSTVSIKNNSSTVIGNKKEDLKSTMKIPEKQKQPIKPLQCFDQPNFQDSLQALINLGFPEQQVKNVTAAGAKERGNVLIYLKQNPYQNYNAIVRVLRKVFKDWKQVNLMMNKDLIAYLQQRATDIGKEQAYVLMPYIVQKIGDSKFSQPLYRIISQMCKKLPGKYVIGHIIKYIRSTDGKKPKLNGDAAVLISKIIDNISIGNCNQKQIADFACQTFAVSFSKKGGIQLLNCMYAHLGESLKGLLDEATIKGMEPEFKNVKVLSQDLKKPKLQFYGEAVPETKVVKKAESKVDNSKPRDLSADVQRLLPKINDNSNWQNRKEAAEALSSLIEQGGKVTYGNPTDLLATIKTRINDPNKQLIKIFVHLAGLVFCSLPERQVKGNIRLFIAAFVQGLNDKNQQNRKQIQITLNKIAETVGKEQVLSNLGPFLEGDKEGRLEVINLILNNEEGISKADIRDYPKGLVNCLCDKNKEIRAPAQRLFQKVYEKLGLQIFRQIAKDQRPAVAKDLNIFLDKFDKNYNTNSSFASKGASPSKISQNGNIPKPRITLQQQQSQPPQAPPQPSAKKRSLSKNNTNNNQKSFIEQEDDPLAATTGAFTLPKRTLVVGDQIFANTKILAKERAERQGNEENYIWRLDQIKQNQEESLYEDIQKLIKPQLARKLLSFNYRRVLDGAKQIDKICKDVSYQGHLRELYDILLKWVLVRLWGGQPALQSIIELLPPLMSILQKKKLALTDFQVDLSITIIREYFISAFFIGFKVSERLYSIIKCLIALSSGEKVLKKILRQFTIELTNIHRHLKSETSLFYRQGLSRLLKTQLMDYVGNEDTLEQASKIKELKQDSEFVQMLYRRLHQNVLSCFGFKRLMTQTMPLSTSNVQQNQVVTNNINNNTSFTSERDKSSERLPPRGHQTTNTMIELRPSTTAAQAPAIPRKNIGSQQNINIPIAPSPINNIQHPNQSFNNVSVNQSFVNVNKSSLNAAHYLSYEVSSLDLSIYPAPHPQCPLAKQLAKLLPPNDSVINFLKTLFSEPGQKVANELSTNAKIIFGSILKSVQELITNRKEYAPDRILAQIGLLQDCIKCPHLIKNVGQLLGYGTGFALSQLVYEDENKAAIYEQLRSRNIDFKSDNFIKTINGVMLRLLENANSVDIVNVLLQLLIYQNINRNPSQKTVSLIVKCMGRVINNFTKDLRPQAIKTFLIKSNQFLAIIEYDTALQQLDLSQKEPGKERIRPDDSAASFIKDIIRNLCETLKSQIWQHYQKAMLESRYPDRYIASYINYLKIKVPEQPRNRSQQKQNDELRKINQLLSKTKSFDLGITQLKKYIIQHPEFSPLEYFTSLNYDQKFISMVIGALDDSSQQKKAIKRQERVVEQPSENIQDKIKKLKQKFQQLQPESGQETTANNSMNRGKAQPQQLQSEQRAQQIRRRIQEMKNKMNTAVNRPRS